MIPVESYSALFNYNLPVGIALFSAENSHLTLKRHNDTWSRIIRASQTDLNGHTLQQLLPNAAPLFNLLQSATKQVEAQGVRLTIADDVVFWDITINVHDDGNLLLIVNDVTEQFLATQLLERRVSDRTRKLSALYDVMEVAVQPVPLKEILDEALRRVMSAVRASGGAIQIFDDAGEVLYLATHHGIDKEVIGRLSVTVGGSGLSGWTAENDATLVLTDLNKDKRASKVLRESDLTVYVGVPMNARERVIGVLNVFRESRRPFRPEDISLLTSAGDQIAVAVENAQLRLDNERLLIVEERNRLARELHDAVTQSLYSLVLFAGATKRQIKLEQFEQASSFIERVESTGQQALKEMRLLVHNLRPDALERAGLEQALRQRLDAVEGRANIQSKLTVRGELVLPRHVEEALYQIAQEALNNALKHANASTVGIVLTQESGVVQMQIQDNGVGFALDSAENGGLGLTSMRERIDLFSGNLTVNTKPNIGTTITVTVNLSSVGEPVELLEIIDLL